MSITEPSIIDISLTVMPHHDDGWLYQVGWSDGEVFLRGIPEAWLDLTRFMAACVLLEQGYDVNCLMIVQLQGADYELSRAMLGAVAATPLVNYLAPVTRATRHIYRGERYRG